MQKWIAPANTPIVNDWNTSDKTIKWKIASSTSCTIHVTNDDLTMLCIISPNII